MVKKSSIDNKTIKDTMMDVMSEFYEQVIFPHFDGRIVPLENDLKEIKQDVKDLNEDVSDLVIKSNQNTRAHDRMFERLDQQDKDTKRILSTVSSIESSNVKQEVRIKFLEKTLQTS